MNLREKSLLLLLFIGSFTTVMAASVTETIVPFLKDECWWGGLVAKGSQMPWLQPAGELDLETQNFNNQGVPLFVSNKGRYIWSDAPFRFSFRKDTLVIRSDYDRQIQPVNAGKTLRDAYLAACAKHFPPTGMLPDSLLFSMPQYNTWIELMYDQTQEKIEAYAGHIIGNGFPAGVLMIDDNWQKYYGNYDFKPDKFQDAKGMIGRLHAMGFKVMVWICPYVSPDSPEFRELEEKGLLLKRKDGRGTFIVRWWNGYSAQYDLTNPATVAYVTAKLKKAQEDYGIDGFKFDGGDVGYTGIGAEGMDKDARVTDHLMAWAKLGREFPFNEYRACWRMGGEGLAQRLGDKDYSWNAVGLLIPDMLAAGLLGYAYTCPDMIGGGQNTAFMNIQPGKFDEALIVRSAQVHAMMPMMQFSVAPWRILNQENLAICRKMAGLHAKMGHYIYECARVAARTGEPIVRHMEYMFPGQGFTGCKDQFMLGDRYLVAPVLTSVNVRTVKLPEGKWRDDLGNVYRGGREISMDVAAERLLYFEKIR